MDHKHIEQLFFKQIKNLTAKTVGKNLSNSFANSFDYQFSDGWVRG